MTKLKRYIAPVFVLIGFAGILLLNLTTVSTQSSKEAATSRQQDSKIDENYLLVDLGNKMQVEMVDEARKKKGQKFDNWNWVRKTATPDAMSVVMANDWQVGLPAIPVDRSDAIIIGTVESGKAFLSNDESGIYSEFSIAVSEWLKPNASDSVKSDQDIIVQRAGGRIRYPSGKILKYTVSGQDMPRINGKYVFFLAYDRHGEVFRIITAYEISRGKVTALDGRGRSRASGFKFIEFDGVDETRLLTDLDNAINSGKNSFE